ncbi:MAG TPA: hypothetical protein VGR85_01995 [Candidatus Limnocylindria bacterium]|nr:hypothetical protein [Candidatus Limnocylindria bacterium]
MHPIDDDLIVRLQAAIDGLPVPAAPTPVLVVRPGRDFAPLRIAAAIGLSAMTLVAALVLGAAIGERRAALSSIPPSPARTADRYGIIVASGGPVVRREDDATQIARLYDEPIHRGGSELGVLHGVSPDGRRVAYWIWGASPPGLGSLTLTKLALFDANSGTTRELLSLPDAAGSGVVWSTDGSGLLVGVGWNSGAASANGPNLARLRTIDLATGKADDVGPAIDSGASGNATLRPLLWDRAADRIVALAAAGNANYATSIVVIDHGNAQSYVLDGHFLNYSIGISSDGKTLAGARTRDFALVAWPVADYAARTEIVPKPGERILSLWWRPRSDQLYFAHDNGLTADPAQWSRLEVWRPGVDSPRVVDPSPSVMGILFRFDGSAYFASYATAFNSLELVETDSGRHLGTFSERIVGTLLLPPR